MNNPNVQKIHYGSERGKIFFSYDDKWLQKFPLASGAYPPPVSSQEAHWLPLAPS